MRDPCATDVPDLTVRPRANPAACHFASTELPIGTGQSTGAGPLGQDMTNRDGGLLYDCPAPDRLTFREAAHA